jgi:nicotinamide riboside kinase
LAPLRRLCLTGAECTGKSTLALFLGERYGGIVIPEYSRTYAEQVTRELTYDDVEPIARGFLQRAADVSPLQASARDDPADALRIFDTDLVSTIVYSRHHYGDVPEWIVAEAKRNLADLYLQLDIDVPWIADGVRDAGARREQLHEEFTATLSDLGANVLAISGDWDVRQQKAIAAIDQLLEG